MNEELENILYRESITLASIKSRTLAFVIDEILLSFLLIIALWDSFSQTKTMEDIIYVSNSFILEYMTMKIFYQAFFVMNYGATLGKIATKIRVIEIKTLQNPSVISSLNRAIFRIISEMLFYLGFVWAMMDPSKQAWHDKTARTLVVNA